MLGVIIMTLFNCSLKIAVQIVGRRGVIIEVLFE